MKFEVVEEVILREGKKEVWYLVEPRNKIVKFFLKTGPVFFYSVHKTKEKAIMEAKLRSLGEWEKTVSRKRV